MKNQLKTKLLFYTTAIILFLSSPWAFAQDGEGGLDIDVDIAEETSAAEWYMNPLYWIIGALVLLLIIAIVARGGRK